MANLEPDLLYQKSIIESILTIFEKLVLLSIQKQKAILENNWDEVIYLTEQMEQVILFLESKDNELKQFYSQIDNKNEDIIQLKLKIKSNIEKYREIESLNAKLLNDLLYSFKQKIEKIYNISINETYSKDTKKLTSIYNDNSFVLNTIV